MRYKHGWRLLGKELDQSTWNLFTKDVLTIMDNLPDTTDTAGGHYANDPLLIYDEGCGGGPPIVNENLVRFNGKGRKHHNRYVYEGLGHETFQLWRDTYGNDCNTARKPYDLVVCAVLIRLAYWFPEGVEITTEGTPEDWEPARELVTRLFGIAILPFVASERV